MIALMLLALGLAMDAVAVAVAHGACRTSEGPGAIRVGAAFGVAQGVMPLAGWAAGLAFASAFTRFDHWIALILLVFLGVRMLRNANSYDSQAIPALAGWGLVTAAIATSLDAAAAGVTLPTIGLPVALACATIGGTTALLSYAGVRIGAFAGRAIGKQAEVAGGCALIVVGLKIFVSHQFLGG